MNPVASFSKEFPIDAGIFNAASVTLGASTDANADKAILANTAFPDGDIQIGHISVSADTGNVSVNSNVLPAGTSVSFEISGSAQAGLGVFGKFADAIAALGLSDPLSLPITDVAGQRYLMLDFGYTAKLTASGSHPIGLLGSVSFGVNAQSNSTYALLHRFATAQGAHDVMADSLASWRLPRHIAFDGHDLNIKPQTWILVEADGSLALKLAASLGWNMSFAKDLTVLGVTHNLSAKIDASMTANFGFNVSGNYIVVVGREDASNSVRLRLSKQSTKGLNFGLNLNVGVQGADPQLPANFNDFIEATFGVHGLQVLNDLQEWTDPSTDLGQKLAGLANQTALDLLKSTTGIDPAAEFDKAKAIVANALNQWTALPDKLSSMLWTFLGKQLGAQPVADFKTFLTDLANPATGASALAGALEKATFGDTPEGQFLESIADQGLLALANKLGAVSTAASQVLNILNGGVIAKLQTFIDQKLDLDQIRNAVSDADFNKIDQWLQNRLANFLDKTIGLDDLKDIQKAINTLETKVSGYYLTAVQALTKKYNVQFAATYQSTASTTALLDVTFDLSNHAAAALYDEVVADSDLDNLLTTDTAGVTLNMATLSHDINRQGTVDLNMPFFDFKTTHVNDAIATLTVEQQGGRLLLYQVNAKDSVTNANRAASQLSVLASLQIATGKPPALASSGSIAYEMRQVKASMRPADLEARTSGFIHQYLQGLFSGGDSSIRTFYTDLDNALTAATKSKSNFLGDVAVSTQLSMQSSVLTGWFEPRSGSLLKADQMTLSRALQTAWKRLLPALYFQDLSLYKFDEATAALLVWAAMPVSTSMDSDDLPDITLNTDEDVYWEWMQADLRRAVARCTPTVASLAAELTTIHGLMVEAGNSNAGTFVATPAAIKSFTDLALDSTGDRLLQGLLFTEAQIVNGAADALKSIAAALPAMAKTPSKAITMLANFAAQLTDTFNQRVSSVYGGMSDRVVGPMLLVEASRALGSAGVTPAALMNVYALNPGHTFNLGTFVTGSNPATTDVALTQTLVSLKP